ncbi:MULTISPECIES: polyprenyl synthetase family protein [unclassified Streptomyces]|uniref:polyprenyl synthetase family protein n=1 Tax=unclassified Streptomyces TaxID=2593676 RepID=UPI00209AB646|nr:polyprenyl synthetase family protein [Streptomyces sp. YPW6]
MDVHDRYEGALSLLRRPDGLIGRLVRGEPGFQARIAEALAGAEKQLQDCAAGAPDPRIAEVTGHLVAAGGKRLRPLLVLLGAEFGESWRDGVTQAAVISELVHLASLHHDDVMDGAETRHGVPTVHTRWGEHVAVLGGDWLLARAAQLAAALGAEAVRLNAHTAGRLVSGQLRELTGPVPGEDPVAHYFQVAAGKTAALLAMSLGMGAVQAAAPAPYAEALTEYGEQLGIAFQIADDLLDLHAPAEVTGKEQGKDLLAGVPSLPVLLVRAGYDDGDRELRALIDAGPGAGAADHRRALELFGRSPATARARAVMHERLELARTALGPLPDLPARRALEELCDVVALRSGRAETGPTT